MGGLPSGASITNLDPEALDVPKPEPQAKLHDNRRSGKITAHLCKALATAGHDSEVKEIMDVRKILIAAGVILVAAGLLWPFLSRLGLGRIPGDIAIERGNFRFYFPLVTSLAISAVLTLLFWLFRR
jgi:hypothetical protein